MSDEKQEPLTAEEFIREKIRSKYNIKGQMYALWQYDANADECLRWAKEFSDQQTKALRERNHNLEVTCTVRHDTIQTNILIISELKSELTQVKEHNKQLAEAIQNYLNASNKDAERDTKYNLKLTLDNHQKQTKP